jgi:hypothetical protein
MMSQNELLFQIMGSRLPLNIPKTTSILFQVAAMERIEQQSVKLQEQGRPLEALQCMEKSLILRYEIQLLLIFLIGTTNLPPLSSRRQQQYF